MQGIALVATGMSQTTVAGRIVLAAVAGRSDASPKDAPAKNAPVEKGQADSSM
jgi:hypothetical protein